MAKDHVLSSLRSVGIKELTLNFDGSFVSWPWDIMTCSNIHDYVRKKDRIKRNDKQILEMKIPSLQSRRQIFWPCCGLFPIYPFHRDCIGKSIKPWLWCQFHPLALEIHRTHHMKHGIQQFEWRQACSWTHKNRSIWKSSTHNINVTNRSYDSPCVT